MFAAVHGRIDEVDVFIGAAAVADYHAADVRATKLKKEHAGLSLELTRNPDILASVAKLADRPYTVGFAAETEKLREYAKRKLEQKNLDMIVANLVGEGRAFDSDTNAVEVYWRGGEQSYPERQKSELARDLVALVAKRLDDSRKETDKASAPRVAASE